MTMLNIKFPLLLTCACLTLLPHAYAQEPNRSNTLSLAGSLEFTNIDPSSNGYLFTRMQVTETLLDVNAKGELLPALAQNYQVSDDRKVWSFTLVPDVTFHDGKKMDAEAVVKSLLIAFNKHGPLKNAPIEKIEASSDNQISIALSQPYRPLGAVLAHYANVILSPESYDESGKVSHLYGTGPYKIYTLAPPHKLTVEKFAQYWADDASIQYATYLTGHRAESRALQATSGQADIAFELSPTSVMRMKMQPQIKVHEYSIPRTLVLKLNAGDPLLSSKEARQALSLAINRQGIAAGVLRSPGAEIDQLLPAAVSDWYLNQYQKPQYDIEKARQLLAQLGWDKNGQGMLTRDGKPFELTLITYADRPELTNVATALQDQWRQIGIKLNINITNSSAIPAGHHDGSLQVALMARNYGVIADPLAVLSNDFSPQGGDWGAMNWSNPKLSQLFSTLNLTNNQDEYHQLAQQAAQYIHQGYSLLPIASYTQRIGVNIRVKGFSFDPYERNFKLSKMEFTQ
ncbi:ABC transporter substrate-binding protein [Vibrio rumoiensis]|uniref:ABC transporter substrate-binding protein n=1 Tax=Vibrio rumoiensis TaxID=76258 RepID=UPI000B5C2427|nr:ABC transporter substrate-binding protein [Vibrio rumoiensis]